MTEDIKYPNIFRLITVNNEIGTGFLISRSGYLITAGHLFRNEKEIVVCEYNNRKINATVVFKSQNANLDFAILKTNEDADLPCPLPISCEDINDNLRVFAYGYGEATVKFSENPDLFSPFNLTKFWGKVSLGNGYIFDTVEGSRYVIEGDSGAPIFNEETNNVIGLCYARVYTKLEAIDIFRGKFLPFKEIKSEVNSINSAYIELCQIFGQMDFDKKVPHTENDFSEYFIKKIGSEVESKDLLEIRAQEKNGFQPDFYIERQGVDDALYNSARLHKHSVVVGKPLSGKSRAVYELITKKLNNSFVFFPEKKDIEKSKFILPASSRGFVIYNDIDKFLGLKNLHFAFKSILMSENLCLIATCRRDRLDEVNEFLGEYSEYITQIKILKIDEAIKVDCFKHANPEVRGHADDTIGSYFVNLAAMEIRYHNLDTFGKEILRSYKCVELWRRRNRGKKEIIHDYCMKRFYYHYNDQDTHFSNSDWDNQYSLLEKLGFLTYDDLSINVEEVYIDHFISCHDNEKKLALEIATYYPSTRTFTKLFHRVKNYLLAVELYCKMKDENIEPNEVSYNTLISKAPDYISSVEWFKMMKSENLTPNEVSYSTLISKAPDYQIALRWFEEMKDENLTPNEVSFNTLISKAPDYKVSLEWFSIMKAENLKPTVFSFSTLISKAPDYLTSLEWFDKMKFENLTPNEVSYSTLISKAPTYQAAVKWYEKMKTEHIKPNVYSFTALIGKSEDEDAALRILAEMKEIAVSPNAFTFGMLLHHAAKNTNKQQELIQKFLSVFEVGIDFGVSEFKELQMHPMTIIIFAEEIYKIAPKQREIIRMLLEKVKQSQRTNFITAVNQKYQILQTSINCV